MAELADAHGSGPCDSNIMRVQVPSSARRLKSKDLSLFRYYIFTTFSSIQAKFYWHILAPRAVACDNLHLRASSHHWHIRAFFVIGNFLLRKNLPDRSLHQEGFLLSPAIKPVLFLLIQQALQSPLRR